MPAEKSRTATTRITAFIEQDTLILRIWDNGCGIPACRLEQILSNIQLPKDPSDERDAITLKNICYRFSLIYAEQFHFSIRSEENVYTEVELAPYLSVGLAGISMKEHLKYSFTV